MLLLTQKNLVKAIIKFMPGFGPRVSRNFAFVVAAARKREEECEDGSMSRAEAFKEGFAHLIFHLQGINLYVVKTTPHVVPRSN